MAVAVAEVNEAAATPENSESRNVDKKKPEGSLRRVFSFIGWTPEYLRWKPDVPYELSWSLNVLFALVAAFEVGNLAYTHPILHILAKDFNVTDERASMVPTMLQTGYTAGLLLICPAGDLLPRRPLIIFLIFATAILWLACTVSTSFEVFMGLHFLVGMFTVSAQLAFPLVVRYASVRHRAVMTAVTMSGITFGVLLARLISGIITQFVHWRVVYWVSFGLQIGLLVTTILLVPDFPVISPPGATYPGLLRRLIMMPLRHPVLLQQALLGFLVMAMFTCFWTTLTFQLSARFHLSTLVIGLFALVGLSPILVSPAITRVIMRRYHPSGVLLGSHVFMIAALCVGTFVGNFSIGGIVIWASFGDLAMSIIIVANRMAFASVEPRAQNVVNAVYMVISFCGQLFGTAVGNKLYAHGGWIHSGGFAIGLMGLGLLLVLVRGPHETGWVGWRGGWELRTSKLRAVEVHETESSATQQQQQQYHHHNHSHQQEQEQEQQQSDEETHVATPVDTLVEMPLKTPGGDVPLNDSEKHA